MVTGQTVKKKLQFLTALLHGSEWLHPRFKISVSSLETWNFLQNRPLNVYKDPYGNIPRTTTILMQRSGSKKWWDLTPKRTVIEWDIYRNIVLMTGVSRRAITHPRHQGRFGQERNMYRISVVSDTYRNIVLMTGVHHDEPSHDTQQSQVRHTGVTQGRWAMSSSS